MNIPEPVLLKMLAYEAFLRRASEINMPFMLKGSYVTRQYFANSTERLPGDVDWVYMEKLQDPADAEKVFDNWVTAVTEQKIFDGVNFRSFKENRFWRMIDYAMAEDFPTVNTDLLCWVGEQEVNPLLLDISFNLNIEAEPIPLLYKPLQGKPFTIPFTVPLCLQVSWKLHQTLTRPRFKDIFDLIHLLKHPDFNLDTMRLSLQALINECSADNVDMRKLTYLFTGNLTNLFAPNELNEAWDYWRHKRKVSHSHFHYYEMAEDITDISALPYNFSAFEAQFMDALHNAGFNADTLKNLPTPSVTASNRKKAPYTETQINTSNNIITPKSKATGGILSFLTKLFK